MVLASDGVIDVLTEVRIAALIRGIKDPQRASIMVRTQAFTKPSSTFISAFSVTPSVCVCHVKFHVLLLFLPASQVCSVAKSVRFNKGMSADDISCLVVNLNQ